MMPPRSRLYNLEPVGLKTAYVESFSGYMSRLTEKHGTTLYFLFSEEVAPLINKPGTIGLSVSFASFAKAVNGAGIIAADLVKVFQTLTLFPNLQHTTMLPWASVISSKSLTRKYRAWCPLCYEDNLADEKDVYDQLLWTIQSVTVCLRHKNHLMQKCPCCGRKQHQLSHHIRPGFCANCGGWLASTPAFCEASTTAGHITTGEIKTVESIGELLALAPTCTSSDLALIFRKNLECYAHDLLQKRAVPANIDIPLSKQTLISWLNGTQRPSLPLLSQLCLALKRSLVDLLEENKGRLTCGTVISTEEKSLEGSHIAKKADISNQQPVNWKDTESVFYAKSKLRANLNEKSPLSLTGIAKHLKCTTGTLRKKFPTLAAQTAEKSILIYRPSVDRKVMLRALQTALKEAPPPSLNEVSGRLGAGASTTTLHKKFPDESRAIVNRYCASNKRRLDNKAIKGRLRAALRRVSPVSLPEVSREINVAATTLYRKFPDLCKRISNRSATHRRERNTRNKRSVRVEVTAVCKRAIHEGRYPSYAWVRSQLSVKCRSDVYSRIRREVLVELKYEPNYTEHRSRKKPPH